MNVHEFAYYSKFECTKQNCPYTCCRGWKILVDEEAKAKIKALPGSFGRSLRRGLMQKDGLAVLRQKHGFCPFLTDEKICKIQATLSEDYMPYACVLFPRIRTNYGLFAEESLSLGCPEVVKLFLHHLEELTFHNVEKEVTYACTGSNGEYGFLSSLTGIRTSLCKAVANRAYTREHLYSALFCYGLKLQQYYVQSGMPEKLCPKKPVFLPSLEEILEKEKETFSLSVSDIDHMMTGGFYHKGLRKASPPLYELCLEYFRTFDSRSLENAQNHMELLINNLHSDYPGMEKILRGILICFLQMRFLETYENYSFLRFLRLAVMHTQLLELLIALYYEKHHSLNEEELMVLISVYHRRGSHNPNVEDGMYDAVFSSVT